MKHTSISDEGLQMIQQHEGLRLNAYRDSGGLPTIGVGATVYPNGSRVKMGDTCTTAQAMVWLRLDVAAAEKAVDELTVDTLTQRQFDALVSLVYNLGKGAYRESTVRRLVNLNPKDPKIADAFKMWNKVNGTVVKGLVNRRAAEAKYYFG